MGERRNLRQRPKALLIVMFLTEQLNILIPLGSLPLGPPQLGPGVHLQGLRHLAQNGRLDP